MTNWALRDEKFKLILHRNNNPDNEAQSVESTKRELIPHLKSCPCYARLGKQTIEKLENATTFHAINQVINDIYNYCDENRIWLGFMTA